MCKYDVCLIFRKYEETDHSEDQGVDGRMGSEWIVGSLAGEGVDWIRLVQDITSGEIFVNR
jgi:hypothetical protein